jgi:hypothetical protein
MEGQGMKGTRMKIEDMDPDLQRTFSKIPNLPLDKGWVRWLVRRLPSNRQKDPKPGFGTHTGSGFV